MLLQSLLFYTKEMGMNKDICQIINKLNYNNINLDKLEIDMRNILNEIIKNDELVLFTNRKNIPALNNKVLNLKK